MNFLFYVLSTIGFTSIVTEGFVFRPFVNWMSKRSKFLGKLFSCSQCFGVWAGFLFGYLFVSQSLIGVLCCGFMAGFFVPFILNINKIIIKHIEYRPKIINNTGCNGGCHGCNKVKNQQNPEGHME